MDFDGPAVNRGCRGTCSVQDCTDRIRNLLGCGSDSSNNNTFKSTTVDIGLTDGHVVADGLYSWAEYLYLKKRLKEKMVVLAIQASPRVRYRRITGRQERALSAKEAQSRDYADIAHIEKAGPIAMADETVLNEGSVQKLRKMLDGFIDQQCKP